MLYSSFFLSSSVSSFLTACRKRVKQKDTRAERKGKNATLGSLIAPTRREHHTHAHAHARKHKRRTRKVAPTNECSSLTLLTCESEPTARYDDLFRTVVEQ